MSSAICTLYLRSLSIWIWYTFYSIRKTVIEGRPPASCIKLAFGRKERLIASPADIRTLFVKVVIFSREWRFGCLVYDYSFLVSSQLVVTHLCFSFCFHVLFAFSMHKHQGFLEYWLIAFDRPGSTYFLLPSELLVHSRTTRYSKSITL